MPAGQAAYTVTTGGGTPAMRARDEAASSGAWTIGSTTMKPKRLTVSYEYNIEDAARIPGLADALRRDMRAALRERLDYIVFRGDTGADGSDADIAGFFDVSGTTALTLSVANLSKFPETIAKIAGLVDGLAAGSLSDLRIVVSAPYNVHLVSTSANTSRNETIAQILRGNGITWRVRGGIDNAITTGKRLAAIGKGNGIAGAGVAAIWSDATIVRDPFSGATAGKIALSLHTLWDLAFPRASNFAKLAVA